MLLTEALDIFVTPNLSFIPSHSKAPVVYVPVLDSNSRIAIKNDSVKVSCKIDDESKNTSINIYKYMNYVILPIVKSIHFLNRFWYILPKRWL